MKKPSLYNYILSQKDQINSHKQQGFSCEKYKIEPLISIREYKNCLDKLKEALIDRDFIINCFKKDSLNYYEAFVYAMIWGGINHTRPSVKGDKTSTYFHMCLEFGSDNINNVLQSVYEFLDNENLGEAFDSMLIGNNKIPGVGISYFTKILFFLGQKSSINIKPLIYDKWTKAIHVLYLLENNENEKLYNFYTQNSINKLIKNHELIQTRKNKEKATYLDYVTIMNNLSDKCEIEDVGNLESFLFGYPKNKNKNNPRLKILSLLNNFKK
jgi:hypothetical protein